MAALAAAALAAGLVLAMVINQLANDVVDAAEGAVTTPQGTAPETGDGELPQGTADPGAGNGDTGDGDLLPVSTSHCSINLQASAAALGLGVGLGTTAEVIIQEMPDGTTIVTIAGELAGNGGPGTAAGAGVTVNDATVGAYAAASAKLWAGLGGGVQFELAPGETVADLFVGLAVSTNPVTGPISSGINMIVPGTVPQAPLPDTLFVDRSVWGKAGGTAQAGVGWVSAGAVTVAEARTDQTYAIHADGTYSATTTYSGALSSDAGVTGDASGSVSVETIYNGSFEPVEMIVTTTYGYDADLVAGDDEDPPTITTQQWNLDLTRPEVQQAVDSLGAFSPTSPILDIPTQNPIDSWDIVADNATSSGAVTQELPTSTLDIKFEAGAIAAGVGGRLIGTCTELN